MRVVANAIVVLGLFMLVGCSSNHSRSDNQKATANYFNQIKSNPNELQLFIEQMPKGGDIHNHLSGAVYAETVIQLAEDKHFCVNPKTLALSSNKDCSSQYQLKNLKNNYDLYNHLVNYWSLRLFARSDKLQRLDFFDSFLRAVNVVNPERGGILASIVARNADEHVDYVELLVLPKTNELLTLASKVPLKMNYAQQRNYLLKHGLPQLVNAMQTQIQGWVDVKNKLLHCGTINAQPGCSVVARFQFIALRAMPSNMVFPQLLAGFILANQDSQVVGVNIVGPEDAPLTLQNYTEQMNMFSYLHSLYPKVKISLHAGELVPGLVPPSDLRFHVRQALLIGHANRIGHGVDIAYEHDALQTLHYMAQNHIAVEVCLTSNARLLNLKGKAHPILLYLKNHVPVTLNTDDEGVLRTDLNLEYKRAELSYDFNYATLKQFARNALTYNFLPGASLWLDAEKHIPASACASDELGAAQPSISCTKFLQDSAKAQLQWHLEQQFNQFEAKIAASVNA